MTNTENGAPEPSRARWDEANKRLFSVPEAVLDLMGGYVLPRIMGGHEWFRRFDSEAMILTATEDVTPDLQRRLGDIQWMMPLRDAPVEDPGNWLQLIIALEFQQTIDWSMAQRLRLYADLKYDRIWGERTPGKNDRLPAVLPVVLYAGEQRWTAPTCCDALVDPRLVPPGLPEMPMSFSGNSYMVVDLLSLLGQDLADQNVISLMARTLGMTGIGQAVKILEDSVILPRVTGRRFLPWFRVATQKTVLAGIDLLKDPEMMEQLVREDEFRPLVQIVLQRQEDELRQKSHREGKAEGLEEGREEGRAEGREEGRAEGRQEILAREREVFRSMVERKFGGETVARLTDILDRIDDQDRLGVVGNHIIDCDDGGDLIARLDELA